ncbi:MAG: TetR family transcriptional regulator, partial [Firmicutes bacterium]|nr:TetR family transcriptional regulator [Bacillota bacterium]
MVRKHAKQLLEQSLMELLDETTLDKIDVRELTSKANLSRQTFYYNFKNKQDMVNWIFDKNNEAARQVFLKNHSIREYILTVLNTIVKYRTFYANVLVGEYGESGMPGPFENGIIRSVQEIELHSPKGRM